MLAFSVEICFLKWSSSTSRQNDLSKNSDTHNCPSVGLPPGDTVSFWDFWSELNDHLWNTSQATEYLLSTGKGTSVTDVWKLKRSLLFNSSRWTGNQNTYQFCQVDLFLSKLQWNFTYDKLCFPFHFFPGTASSVTVLCFFFLSWFIPANILLKI